MFLSFQGLFLWMFVWKTSTPTRAHSLKNHRQSENIFSVSKVHGEKLGEMPTLKNTP